MYHQANRSLKRKSTKLILVIFVSNLNNYLYSFIIHNLFLTNNNFTKFVSKHNFLFWERWSVKSLSFNWIKTKQVEKISEIFRFQEKLRCKSILEEFSTIVWYKDKMFTIVIKVKLIYDFTKAIFNPI